MGVKGNRKMVKKIYFLLSGCNEFMMAQQGLAMYNHVFANTPINQNSPTDTL